MDFQALINGRDLWLVSSIMVIVSLVQAVFFLKISWTEAGTLGIGKKRRIACVRSAVLTAAGPSLSPIIIMVSMIAIVGGPTTWMVLNNVGAARTELAVVTLASEAAGVSVGAGDIGIQAFTYALWAIALNGFGWLFVVFMLTHRMTGIVVKMNERFDPRWVKLMLGGTNLGLFAYLLSNQLVGKASSNYLAAIIAGAAMLVLTSIFKKYQFLQEISLGASLLTGMFLTQLII